MAHSNQNSNAWKIIIIASLGYFVDIYDLLLFQIVKKQSLADIGITKDLFALETDLFNYQMTGMLIGGIIWGILGDKRGRIQVLFGSILLYSLANIANAFVTDTVQYGWCRFFSGLGLAGELGAGITLVVETMSKEKRGYGTMIIVTFGALGAVAASLVGKNIGPALADFFSLDLKGWQMTYIIGGVLGLLLLILRAGAYESGMFHQIQKQENVSKGEFFMLFKNKEIFGKYLKCILVGLPIWYVVGVLIAFAEKFRIEMQMQETIEIGTCVLFTYVGLSFGDLLSGLFSQWFSNRRKIIMAYIGILCVSMLVYLHINHISANMFYFMCFVLGTSTGYWALFVTIASEQFGTNIRSTVTNTVPNFVRGAVVPMTWGFKEIAEYKGVYEGALVVGFISIGLAFYAIYNLKESFGKDLNYLEE